MAAGAADAGKRLLVPLRFALPLGLLVFQVIWWSLANFRYVRELNNFAYMLLNLPQGVKQETMRPVRKGLKAEGVESDESHSVPTNVGYKLPALSIGCPTSGVARRAMREAAAHARDMSKARQL
jgi:hypothetical protein